MCRSIKQLRRTARDVTEEEIEAAARQFVRKVSGYRTPGRATAAAFAAAVAEIADATRRLLAGVGALPEEQVLLAALPATSDPPAAALPGQYEWQGGHE